MIQKMREGVNSLNDDEMNNNESELRRSEFLTIYE